MSRIEQIIDEIEEFIEGCKPAPFSQSKIVVPKDQLYELLTELRLKTPDEIRRYKKIIEQKDKIISDAKEQAQQMIDETTVYANQLVEDHEIMLKAYEKAEKTINDANAQAQEILDNANQTANEITLGSLNYSRELISNIQSSVASSIEVVRNNTNGLIDGLDENMKMLTENNEALSSQIGSLTEQQAQAVAHSAAASAAAAAPAQDDEQAAEDEDTAPVEEVVDDEDYDEDEIIDEDVSDDEDDGDDKPDSRKQQAASDDDDDIEEDEEDYDDID